MMPYISLYLLTRTKFNLLQFYVEWTNILAQLLNSAHRLTSRKYLSSYRDSHKQPYSILCNMRIETFDFQHHQTLCGLTSISPSFVAFTESFMSFQRHLIDQNVPAADPKSSSFPLDAVQKHLRLCLRYCWTSEREEARAAVPWDAKFCNWNTY